MRISVVSVLSAVAAAASGVRDDTLLCADVSVIIRDCWLESCCIVLGIPIPEIR